MNTPSIPSPRRLRLQDIEKQGGDRLYVWNRAKRDNKPMLIILTHTLPDSNGKTENVPIPITWIPIDLTEYFPKEELLKDANLLKLLRLGYLEFCTEEDADEIFESEEARAERDRIYVAQTQIQKHMATVETLETGNPNAPMPGATAPTTGQLDMTYNGIDPALIDCFVTRAQDETMTDQHKYSIVRTLIEVSGLDRKNLEFVLQHAKAGGSLSKLATENLKKG